LKASGITEQRRVELRNQFLEASGITEIVITSEWNYGELKTSEIEIKIHTSQSTQLSQSTKKFKKTTKKGFPSMKMNLNRRISEWNYGKINNEASGITEMSEWNYGNY
jgi:hypothetical protein